ncbi:DUF3990 domain-containing protein [bacterium]|nr:DUF3990 domain-containing protein [bacterium]MDY3023484.1 DUF3990 domain-containing protein [Oliverpabstia sp.]
MIVYHGTVEKIEKPDVKHSKRYLDFGKGFYLTSFEQQAKKWALRKALRQEKKAFVNVYELKDDLKKYRVLSFEKENEKWLDFVCACRRGEELNQEYDIIIGSVANDDVFKTVDMYFRGLWDKEKVLNELRYYKMNDQICIVNQKTLDEVLEFKKSYEVK